MAEEKNGQRRFSDFFNHVNDISKTDAIKRCASFLGGSWTTLREEDFELSVVQAGFVNRIFTCENKTPGEEPGIPKKVILRLYGGKFIEADSIFRNGTIMEEVLVFHAMSERGLGPKLYGIFTEGRVEEYIPSHTLTNEDVTSLETMRIFARKLARMHNVTLPLTRNPPDIFAKINTMLPDYLATGRDELDAMVANPGQEENKAKTMAFDVGAEFEWLKKIQPKIKTRRVLAHGDMNRANCLVIPEAEDPLQRLILIDYEFAAYGFRGNDIGMHFYNRPMDVAKITEKFKSGVEYPTLDERRDFIRTYNEEMKNLGAYELDENDLDNVENMIIEAEYFALVFTLFFRLMITRDWKKFEAMGMKGFWDLFEMLAEQHDQYKEKKQEVVAWVGE